MQVQRSRRGIKILHLLGLMVDIAQVFGQLDGGGKSLPGCLKSDRHKILLLAQLLVDTPVFFAECVVYVAPRFAHDGENLRADVLRRDLELAADVVLAQFAQECVGVIPP